MIEIQRVHIEKLTFRQLADCGNRLIDGMTLNGFTNHDEDVCQKRAELNRVKTKNLVNLLLAAESPPARRKFSVPARIAD